MIRYALSFCLIVLVGCAPQAGDAPEAVVEFSLPDMMCAEGCGAKTKEILSEQPGVKDVLVDFETKSASVAIEEGKFDSDAALAALVDHGFDNSSLKHQAVETVDQPAAKAE